jgi:hypothetical protein
VTPTGVQLQNSWWRIVKDFFQASGKSHFEALLERSGGGANWNWSALKRLFMARCGRFLHCLSAFPQQCDQQCKKFPQCAMKSLYGNPVGATTTPLQQCLEMRFSTSLFFSLLQSFAQ